VAKWNPPFLAVPIFQKLKLDFGGLGSCEGRGHHLFLDALTFIRWPTWRKDSGSIDHKTGRAKKGTWRSIAIPLTDRDSLPEALSALRDLDLKSAVSIRLAYFALTTSTSPDSRYIHQL
jgi:hypothetical protein